MADKANRITEAASRLFFEHGFDRVTTAQVAEEADVAAGTVFRYAATKGELLMMVYNRVFAAAIDEGQRAARGYRQAAKAVTAQVGPIMDAAEKHPDLALVYQREVLFGDMANEHCGEALGLVRDLEASIGELLLDEEPSVEEVEHAEAAARAVFAIVHLAVVANAANRRPGINARAVLHQQIIQIVEGFQATR